MSEQLSVFTSKIQRSPWTVIIFLLWWICVYWITTRL